MKDVKKSRHNGLAALLKHAQKKPSAASQVSTAPATVTDAVMESELLEQVHNGVRNHEFTFYLHPRYELNTRKITGAEALIRWNHPTRGVLGPAAFIGVLDCNGYITRLDRYMWDLVCSTLRGWIVAGMPVVPITINISKTDILAMDVAQVLKGITQNYQIPSRYIEIDISRTAYLEAPSVTLETENALRREGYRITLDGFGGNFAELSTIRGIQADAYKLNVRAMQNADENSISGVMQQAAERNIRIEAIGIERIEQLHALRLGGCAEGQGYFFSRPLTIESFEQVINPTFTDNG